MAAPKRNIGPKGSPVNQPGYPANSEYATRRNGLIAQDVQRAQQDIAFHEGEQADADAEKTAAWNQMMGQMSAPGSRLPGEPR